MIQCVSGVGSTQVDLWACLVTHAQVHSGEKKREKRGLKVGGYCRVGGSWRCTIGWVSAVFFLTAFLPFRETERMRAVSYMRAVVQADMLERGIGW